MMVYRCGLVFFVVAFTLERRYCLTCDCYRFQNALVFSKPVLHCKTTHHVICYGVFFLCSRCFFMRFTFCTHSTDYFCQFSVPFPPTIPFLSLQDLLFLMTSFAQLGSHYHLISSCSFCTVLHQLISASTHFCAFWSSGWRLMTGVWSWFAGMMSDWEDRWLFWNDVWCKTLDVCVCSFLHILQRKSFVLRWFTCRFIF